MKKSNREYWADRAEKRKKRMEALTDQQPQGLAQSLRDAQRQVTGEIERFYSRYAKDNHSTYAEAQKVLSLPELREFRGDLEGFRRLALQNKGKFSLEVENLSTKARVTRYQALNAQIEAILKQTYQGMEKAVTEGAKAVYDDQYHRTLWDMDRYTGFMHSYVGVNQKAVGETIRYPFDGLDYSQRIWRQQGDLSYRLQTTLNTMLTTGERPEKYVKEFAAAFGVKANEAHRLLYTEHAYVAEQAALQGYRDTGVETYEILATLDMRTSEICQEQDGKQYRLEEAVVGENYPPFHPWCRTTTIAVVEGMTTGSRAARNPQTGETYSVPGDLSYKQWRQTLTHPKRPGASGVGSGILSTQRDEALNRYISAESYSLNAKLREEVPLTEDEEQWVEELDSVLESYPRYQGVVNRTLLIDSEEELMKVLERYKPGQHLLEAAYTSASTLPDYHEEPTVRMVIHSKNGRDLRGLNASEQEILFARNTAFVVREKKVENGVIVIEMEEDIHGSNL